MSFQDANTARTVRYGVAGASERIAKKPAAGSAGFSCEFTI